MKTVTTGVDNSEKFLPLNEFSKLNDNPEIDNNILVGFVDTEGQGGKMLEISTILDKLDTMTNLAKQITRVSQCQNQSTKPYGHLHIIFRFWNNNSAPACVKKEILEPKFTHRGSEKYTITSIFERMQVVRVKTLAKGALNGFHTLIDKMDPQYIIEGCNDEGIDEYLYKERRKKIVGEKNQHVAPNNKAENLLKDICTFDDKMGPQNKSEGCDYEGVDTYLHEKLETFKEQLKLKNFSDSKWNSFDYNERKLKRKERNQRIAAKNEKGMQIVRANELVENASKDFRTLVEIMDSQQKKLENREFF
ncbi:Guanylate-binding protein [Gigaspora margarita]|uniref:Guanylate-binding protein n=1 Tax=Gigaspora margarita TaxID=4874 RepID=A0A8H4AVA4_GIGMA|nr:Guanylate-binding protein [Gigaspora margarita]